MTEKRPCGRCKRPGKLRALYARSDGGVAYLVGYLGPFCLYVVAREVSRSGYRPEYEDARVIVLRGGR